jgi:sugar phosphate isomerase/epimerase
MGAATLTVAGRALAMFGDPNLYAPYRMGIQSYSLRGYDFNEAAKRASGLGLTYIEAFPGHLPQTDDPAQIKKTLDYLKSLGLKLNAWGVQGFDGDEAAARRTFVFAKAMGLESISADPSPEALPILDKLVKEFKIAIAIHNHGPGARYDGLSSVMKAVEGHDVLIGACVDTGHVLRSGEDPVDWVKALGKRVHGLHLKDVKDKTQWKVLGQGDLRLVDLLRELKKIKYRNVMSLEYEENPENPIPDVTACLAAARVAIGEANKK